MAILPETRAQILRLYHAEKWRCGTIARQLVTGVPKVPENGRVESAFSSPFVLCS